MRWDGGDGEGDGKMRRQGCGSALSFGHSHRRIWDRVLVSTGLGNICLQFAGVGFGASHHIGALPLLSKGVRTGLFVIVFPNYSFSFFQRGFDKFACML